ncbi:hypothetical protein QQ054_10765 [Oscillatoria amoena NRMC-F 0135]|nr:hypothetical protein [Oscillatoria amoena NRMC-F 0135]
MIIDIKGQGCIDAHKLVIEINFIRYTINETNDGIAITKINDNAGSTNTITIKPTSGNSIIIK